ncbi:hypothetical protein B0H16DRAFT_1529727 [Mycena metata]|uniref:Transmembrane protein n=1 Tax=Mycena metata TaxID=1033252 RepID=A0AAD7NIZ1_9AGAR|nr:hypothetical protein B0H16DRAFT_1529727 [Mycena metata]
MSGVLTSIIGDITDAFPPASAIGPLAPASTTLAGQTATVLGANPVFTLHTLPGPGPPPTTEISSTASQTGVPTDSSSSTSLLPTSTSSPTLDQATEIPTSTKASFTPTSTANVNLSANSATSFIKTHAVIIGVAAGLGLLVALLLIYVITRAVRTRRQRRLDHELDVSFDQLEHTRRTIGATRNISPRGMPSMDDKSHSLYSDKSSYPQPPLEHYQYSYDLPQSNDLAPREYVSDVGAAELGAASSTMRRPEPALTGQLQTVQAYGSMPAQSLVRAQSQSAAVYGRSPSPGQYLSPYPPPGFTQPPGLSLTTDMPLLPLPNPYGDHDGNGPSYVSPVPPPSSPSTLSAEMSPPAYNPRSPGLPNPYGE